MRRTILRIVGLVGLLLLLGYIFLRFSLQKAVSRDEKNTGEAIKTVDSLGGKKVSAVDLRPIFLQRVQQLIAKASNGLYQFSAKDIQVDLLASSLRLHNVQLRADSLKQGLLQQQGLMPSTIFSIQAKDVVLEGINLDDVLTRRTMDYKLVRVVQPTVIIHRQKGKRKEAEQSDEEWAQRFLKEMKKLSVEKLVVEGGTLVVYNKTKTSKPTRLYDLSVQMNEVLIDSTTRQQKDRFLFAKQAALSFRNFSKTTADGLYDLKVGTVNVNATQHQVKLAQLSFASPLSRKEFVRRQKKSKELYQLSLPSVTLNRVDWWSLLNEEELLASEVTTKGGRLSVYLDRSLPPRNKMGNFPNQLLMKVPLRMDIIRANIRNLLVAYTEYNPLSKEAGTVYIDNVNLDIANLNNQHKDLSTPLTVKGTALFMRKVPLQAQFRFDRRQYRQGKFSAYIKANGFDGRLVNSFAQPLGLVRLDKGMLQSAEVKMSGDEHKASGEVFIPYEDLKLSLLEKDRGKRYLDKKNVTSFLANILVLKNDNPNKSEEPRRVEAEFIRQPEGGFFMLVWKTLLVGALKSMGAPTKIAYKKSYMKE